MSPGSGSAIITGATAIAAAAWCGGLVTGTTIITTTGTTTIIMGTTTGIVTDDAGASLCNACGANGLVLRRVFTVGRPADLGAAAAGCLTGGLG